MARTRSSATATPCSAPTSSRLAATRRWAAPGATSTSLRSGARSSGRTRPRAIPRRRRTSGGSGTTRRTEMGHADKAARLLELHRQEQPLLLVNAWDAGSARLLESLAFDAIAPTSSGHAAPLGRLDGQVGRAEALAHAADLVAATDLPVSADLENGFGPDA